jgi:hypothetical protein
MTKRDALRVLLVAAAVIACPHAAWSQEPLDQRTTLAFDSVVPATVFKFIAQTRGYEPVIDPALQQKVSLRLENVRYRVALDALCDSVGCRWRLDGKKLVVEALRPEPTTGVSFGSEEHLAPLRRVVPAGTRFENVTFGAALEALSRVAGPDVTISVRAVDVSRVVTVDIGSKTVQSAIRSLLAAAGVKPGVMYTVSVRRPGYTTFVVVGMMTGKDLD